VSGGPVQGPKLQSMYVVSSLPPHPTVPQTGTFFDKTEPRVPDYAECFLLPIEISHAKKTDDVSKYDRRIFRIGSKEFSHSQFLEFQILFS
jgi:hypothetical protein